MEELIKSKQRNLEVERFAVNELIRKTKGYIDPKMIESRVSKYLYNGIYLVTSEELVSVENHESVKGAYNGGLGAVILDEKWYSYVPDVAIHEAAHAYLNDECKSVVEVNDQKIKYGIGLEEGAVSIIQKVDSIVDIDNCVVDSYIYQAHLFKQLNTLYGYTKSKKYENLLLHLFKEPADFIPAVHRIYYDILSSTNLQSKEIINLSYRCAGALVGATDMMVESNKSIGESEVDAHYFYTICSTINSICLAIVDEKIRENEEENMLFPKYKPSYISAEEKLLSRIFGISILDDYYSRQVNLLNGCLTTYFNEFDKIDSDTMNPGSFKKKVR